MSRKYGKKNEVKINPLAYNICLLGEPKIGKTTIVKEMLETLVGEDGYMFLELAGEAGADAINGIVAEDCDSWSDIEDIIDDIEENRDTDYQCLKALVFDTYDGWIKLAEEEAIRLWNNKNPDKRTETLDAAWGGFQKGEKYSFNLMFDVFTRLRRMQITPIIIGHVKNRNLTDVASGDKYQVLTSDVDAIYFGLLKKKMHFMGLAYFDRTIITEKTGEKNLVTKKDITRKKVTGESRKIKFRDDNMALDSGSRFADIVEEINFDSNDLIKALTDAIKAEHAKSGKTVDESREEQEIAEAQKLKEFVIQRDKNEQKKELEEVLNKITDFIKANKTNMSLIKPILAKTKDLGFENPTKIDNVKDAMEVLNLIK